MSKLLGLKKEDIKTQFIENVNKYQNGINNNKSKSKHITLSMNDKYIELIRSLSKQDRLTKSGIIRAALISFAKLSKSDREKIYDENYED
ncbi:hypothetical protein [Rickettsia endosymbiont of Oedothorax gibbosus]|uniref:hypothetical protein n=1 Tax=Rickettsia endosymbiont of Oedothorax gibbosus TaxID=931099 RepID=UPI0020259FE5|nr:hypothetical protein [Rickettsia endosymbiont of Oedothorax gibbosus]